MGIKDLLRFMKPFVEPIHIEKYAGKRVGVDAYSWLYKGAYSCSMELCLNSEGDGKLRYLQYFMHRINLLRHYEITPVVVFDGGSIPCKALTEQERQSKRKANNDLAMQKLKEGNVSAAAELFQRSVSITPSMAHQLIQILKQENIEFVVAPYEADAQLAYLSSLELARGGIVAVITEDSDLLAYGCPATIFKMDRSGNGKEIVMDKVFNSVAPRPSFQKFDKELFIGMCVLAGCDFLPSVPGIGIVRAHSLVSKYRNLDRVLSILKFDKGDQMPDDYMQSFKKAAAVFQHAQIYDAHAKRIKHMKPLPQKLLQYLDGDIDFLGPDIPPSVASAIARGNLDPSTMEAFDHFPSSASKADSIMIKASAWPQQSDRTDVPTQESCFTVFTNAAEAEIISEKVQQKPAADESKYSREAVAMAQMIPLPEVHGKVGAAAVSQDTPVKVPNNNPFKKRTIHEVDRDGLESFTEQVSEMTQVHSKVETSTVSPDTPSKVPDNNPFKKRKTDRFHPIGMESTTENASEVIDVEDSTNPSIFVESQESVDSKPKTSNGFRGKPAKKWKSRFEISRSTKIGTILNFFTKL